MRKKLLLVAPAVLAVVVGLAGAPAAQAANHYHGISWYWIQHPHCGYFDCYQMKVKASNTECPDGLYVELNEYNRNGDIVGYTNDVVSSLGYGETAILTFDSIEDSAVSARLSKMHCY